MAIVKVQAFDVIDGPHKGEEGVIIEPSEKRASAGHVYIRRPTDGQDFEVRRRHLKPSRKLEMVK